MKCFFILLGIADKILLIKENIYQKYYID